MTQIDRLLGIMKRLRDPQTGCPWDKEQTFATIAPYTLEETYEVLDAIAREDFDDLRGELGDLLFQVVFYAQMAQEEGRFNFDDICAAISVSLATRISATAPRCWPTGRKPRAPSALKKRSTRRWTIFRKACLR